MMLSYFPCNKKVRRMHGLAMLLCATLMSACGSSDSPNAGSLAWETIDTQAYSGVQTARTAVIRDPQSWTQLWIQHATHGGMPLAAPPIDFNSHIVAAVFLGSRPNGCYSVSIQRVYRTEGRIRVEYTAHVPSSTSVCTLALTAPSHIVAIPATVDPVDFVQTPDTPGP